MLGGSVGGVGSGVQVSSVGNTVDVSDWGETTELSLCSCSGPWAQRGGGGCNRQTRRMESAKERKEKEKNGNNTYLQLVANKRCTVGSQM
jgi:hypothetical protein